MKAGINRMEAIISSSFLCLTTKLLHLHNHITAPFGHCLKACLQDIKVNVLTEYIPKYI
jgi:hypothetical protein